jgi:phosphatidylethanolamine/phosphatidyl-N-methylethanolamine N-methyltransferase
LAQLVSIGSGLKSRLVFYGQVFKATSQVGAFSLTSRAVAKAVAERIPRGGKPLRVLEVGAGTGAATRAVLARLEPKDRFDIYEINPEFVRFLRAELEGRPGPRIAIHEADATVAIGPDEKFDAIVSTLPLLNMPPGAVRRVFDLYARVLLPGGTLSYYDYWLKSLRPRVTPSRAERARMREVLEITHAVVHDPTRWKHETRVIPWNAPPALVHHLTKL